MGRRSRSRDPVALIGGGEMGRKDSRDGNRYPVTLLWKAFLYASVGQ